MINMYWGGAMVNSDDGGYVNSDGGAMFDSDDGGYV